jgi:hypothetical protein
MVGVKTTFVELFAGSSSDGGGGAAGVVEKLNTVDQLL